MDFDKYTAEDFALHLEFRRWVISPDRASNEFWANWLNAHPESLTTITQARFLVENLAFVEHKLSSAERIQMAANIDDFVNENSYYEMNENLIPLNSYAITAGIQNRKSSPHNYWVKWLSYAAAILILAATTFFINEFVGSSSSTVDRYVTKESPRGQKTQLNLPDGSRVWLNAGSSVKYLEHFSESKRDIYLEGEAYFEVIKDSLRPFTVYTGDISTTALGTSFNINHFGESSFTDVALLSGKVVVKSLSKTGQAETELVLERGQMVRYDNENQELIRTNFDLTAATNWIEGIISFKDASYVTIMSTLERMYNVEIETNNVSMREWSYNGHFDNENLELVLKKIALTEDFEYRIDKNHVVITFNR